MRHLGKKVKQLIEFDLPGDFESYYQCCGWLSANGYCYGSTGRGSDPVAIRKGNVYDLPQKWHNINQEGRKIVDGVMYVNRTGPAKIYIFN